MADGSSFYITTPIFYVNDVPHIGHAYTEVAADVLARWHRQAGDDTWLLTGTDEHGQKILRTATANGVTPQEWADKLVAEAWKPLLETIDIANDDFIRTTDERHEVNVAEVPAEALRRRPHLHRRVRGLLLRRLRGVQAAVRPRRTAPASTRASSSAPSTPSPSSCCKEKNYFFRMSAFARPAARPLRGAARLRAARVGAQRGRLVREAGPRRPVDLAVDVRLGREGAVGRLARRLRLVRRAAQLHHRGRLRPGRRRVRAPLAGAAHRRQGHPALPRRHLAGHAHGGRPRRARAASSATAGCSSAARRCRSRSSPASRPTQITDTFGSDAFRYYFLRAITFGQDGSFSWEDLARPLPGRARQRLRQPRLARRRDGRRGTATASCRRPAELLGRRPRDRGDRAAGDGCRVTSAIDRLAIHEAIAATWELVDALNGYITDRSRGRSRRTRHKRERLETVLATAYHGLGTLAVLLSPVLPEGDGEALDRARRATAPCRSSASTARTSGRVGARVSRRSRRCSRASRSRQ